jgi:hypothetical protein
MPGRKEMREPNRTNNWNSEKGNCGLLSTDSDLETTALAEWKERKPDNTNQPSA